MPRKKKKYIYKERLSQKIAKRWGAVDWTLQNSEIAEIMGVSRERARQIRVLFGAPLSPTHGRKLKHKHETMELLKWFHDNRRLSGKITAHDASMRSPYPNEVATMRFRRMAKQAGFEFFRPIRSELYIMPINWELPSSDIARIWKRTPQRISNHRCRVGTLPKALWRHRQGNFPEKYLRALLLEEKKAKKYFKNKDRSPKS